VSLLTWATLARWVLTLVPSTNPFKYGTPEYEAEADRRRGITTFYGRDRGETGTNARYFKDYADYRANAQFEEYNYILRNDGNWYVEFYGKFDGLLSQAIAEELAMEDA